MKVSKRLILNEAVEIRNFANKNKQLPKYATINNSQFSPSQYCYLLSKLISKMSLPTISKIVVKDPSNPMGDTIKDLKMMKNDYVDLAKRVTTYIEKNNQAPNYALHNGKEIRFELYCYCFAKIVSYYKENNRLPNYCLFNSSDIQYPKLNSNSSKTTTSTSTSTTKKTTKKNNCTNPYTSKPHPTKQGCNEMGQNNNYYCGVSALHKVLRKFGITQFTQSDLAKIAGTTQRGTDHQGLETAIAYVSKKTGVKLTAKWYYFSDLGFEKLGKMICKSNVDAILHLNYRNKYGHYEVLNEINTSNNMLKVLNSLGNKCGSSCFCGYVENRSFGTEKQYISGISQKSVLIITKG